MRRGGRMAALRDHQLSAIGEHVAPPSARRALRVGGACGAHAARACLERPPRALRRAAPLAARSLVGAAPFAKRVPRLVDRAAPVGCPRFDPAFREARAPDRTVAGRSLWRRARARRRRALLRSVSDYAT